MPAASRPLVDCVRNSWRSRQGLSLLLMPLAMLYGALARLHRGLFRKGRRTTHRLPVFTVVVGNVIAGGAGKTPVTIALVNALREQGWQVGVVSRGYGRKTQACLEVLADSSPWQTGDEPLLIRQKTSAPVFVAQTRHEAALRLLARYPKTRIIVSDDGLQHYALTRDFEICVFNEEGVMNGRLLPAGPLREPWPRPVNAVLYHGNAPAMPPDTPAWQVKRQLAPVVFNREGRTLMLHSLAKCSQEQRVSVVALAGIANPQAFFAMLREQGVVLVEAIALADHACITTLPATLAQRRLQPKTIILCTEKDAQKLWALLPQAYAVPLITHLPPQLPELVSERAAAFILQE